MSQVDYLRRLFISNNNELTLGKILEHGPLGVGSKYTNKISLLRSKLKLQGMDIKHEPRKPVTDSIYRIVYKESQATLPLVVA